LQLTTIVRPRPGISLSVEGEWNDVRLPEGHFSTRLLRSVVSAQPSPWVSFVNNLQYDTVSRTLGWQLRFRWISRPGDDVYVVYTHNWMDDDPTTLAASTIARYEPRRFQTLDRQATVKILRSYRF
jgi:hypothetical protein